LPKSVAVFAIPNAMPVQAETNVDARRRAERRARLLFILGMFIYEYEE
jgi:hypothetical protein